MNKKMRTGVAAVAAGSALMLMSATSLAEEHPPPPPHGHVMLIGANQEDFTYRKCVDLAAGKPVPLNAHHAHIHTGKAGAALEFRAGHIVVPTEDILPEFLQGQGILPANCAGVDAFLEGLKQAEE